jgi:hypothetical protein
MNIVEPIIVAVLILSVIWVVFANYIRHRNKKGGPINENQSVGENVIAILRSEDKNAPARKISSVSK